jgi:cell division protein FtsL
MRTALRMGFLYLLALLLLFALGHRNQVEKARLARLEAQLEALSQREEALLKEGWKAAKPHRVLDWAKEQGFVPMSQGRWAP